jgi:gas vesicle protein
MGRFVNGVYRGAGIALLVAPMRGEDRRKLVRQRFAVLRGSLTANEQQVADDTYDTVKRSAQQTQRAEQQAVTATRQDTPVNRTTTAPMLSTSPADITPATYSSSSL